MADISHWKWGNLGEWAGAMATFFAVWVALRSSKPSLVVTSLIHENRDSHPVTGEPIYHRYVLIRACCRGATPVRIIGHGFKSRRGLSSGRYCEWSVPQEKILMQGDHMEVAMMPVLLLQGKSIRRLDTAYVIDTVGRRFYAAVPAGRWIARQLYWCFGLGPCPSQSIEGEPASSFEGPPASVFRQ